MANINIKILMTFIMLVGVVSAVEIHKKSKITCLIKCSILCLIDKIPTCLLKCLAKCDIPQVPDAHANCTFTCAKSTCKQFINGIFFSIFSVYYFLSFLNQLLDLLKSSKIKTEVSYSNIYLFIS